jgi:hypothetical protein
VSSKKEETLASCRPDRERERERERVANTVTKGKDDERKGRQRAFSVGRNGKQKTRAINGATKKKKDDYDTAIIIISNTVQ